MRILVDVDGCIADFSSRYLGCLFAATGKRFSPADLTEWDHCTALGISKEEDRAALALVGKNLDFAELPGAVEAVRDFIAEGHEVIFVTSDHGTIKEWGWSRDRWLEKRFPGTPVIHTLHKSLIHGDILIDDKTENCVEWALAHPEGTAVVWAAPYNADAPVFPNLVRVGSWLAVQMIVGIPPRLCESTRIAEGRSP